MENPCFQAAEYLCITEGQLNAVESAATAVVSVELIKCSFSEELCLLLMMTSC